MRRAGLALIALCLVIGIGGRARAALESLNMSGKLDTNSGFLNSGGYFYNDPFAAPTPFSFSAVFDPATMAAFPFAPANFALAQATFNVAGFGTFHSVPGVLFVLLTDPSLTGSIYGAGLVDYMAQGFIEGYTSAMRPFSANAPTPTALAGDLGIVAAAPPLWALLTNSDTLLISGFFGPVTASITLVPEPDAVTLLCLGLAALGFVRWAAKTLPV
jgi:hypothetical protein